MNIMTLEKSTIISNLKNVRGKLNVELHEWMQRESIEHKHRTQ